MKLNYTRPALIGGAAMGVLTALPIVGIGNCCCLWVLGGGALAAYLLQQDHPNVSITLGDGALVGLLAGVFGAFVILVLDIPLQLFLAPMQRQFVAGILERFDNIPPEVRDSMMRGGFTALRIIGGFIFWLVIGSAFTTLGGVIGAAIFQKKLPPAAASGTIDVPPVS